MQPADPSDESKYLETFPVSISNEPVDDTPSLSEVHLRIVNEASGKIPVSEVYIEVDEHFNTINYSIRVIPYDNQNDNQNLSGIRRDVK